MQVIIDKKAVKEINKLDAVIANRIYDYLEKLEEIDPRTKGQPLKGELSYLWRYKVGNYRILAEIQDEELIVLVVRVSHRSSAY